MKLPAAALPSPIVGLEDGIVPSRLECPDVTNGVRANVQSSLGGAHPSAVDLDRLIVKFNHRSYFMPLYPLLRSFHSQIENSKDGEYTQESADLKTQIITLWCQLSQDGESALKLTERELAILENPEYFRAFAGRFMDRDTILW